MTAKATTVKGTCSGCKANSRASGPECFVPVRIWATAHAAPGHDVTVAIERPGRKWTEVYTRTRDGGNWSMVYGLDERT